LCKRRFLSGKYAGKDAQRCLNMPQDKKMLCLSSANVAQETRELHNLLYQGGRALRKGNIERHKA
jgi:hypothetical protein